MLCYIVFIILYIISQPAVGLFPRINKYIRELHPGKNVSIRKQYHSVKAKAKTRL